MNLYLNRSRIAGAIIAGGQASRLGGVIKGNLKINDGNSIIAHLIRQYQNTGIEEIIIIANDPNPYQDYNMEIIPDMHIGIGPLAGIESGINYYKDRCDAVLFMPFDMPNITAKEMLALKKTFISTEKPVVYAVTSAMKMHPLCTIVHCDMKEKITSAIDCGQRKILDVWEQADAGIVQFSCEKAFFNINTPFDINQWRMTEYEKEDLC